MADPRVIVLGAGPAGVRAAQTLVAAGLRPVVIDEAPRAGGQIYRRPPPGFTRSAAALYGTEAGRATAVHEAFDALKAQVDYHPETLAWAIWDGVVHAAKGATALEFPYDALLLATGATDRLMPVPGWDQAGAWSLGAAQIALKAQGCGIGRRVVFAGSGPLLYLVAAQYVKAGAEVAAVLDTAPKSAQIRALPGLMARPAVLAKGLVLRAKLLRAGVPVHQGVTLTRITGSGEADGISWRDARGAEHHIAAEAVALGWHLRPETQLADLAGCALRLDPETRLWLPEIDPDGRSSVPRVYLAGDGARLLGADGAEAAGRLAALAALQDMGRPVSAAEQARLRREIARMDRFRRGLVTAFPWPAAQAAALPDETMICRCEAITAGEIRAAVTGKGAKEINRAKALSRLGMGRCQGRFCGVAGAELIAAAAGCGLDEVGRIRGQAPVKPLPVAATPEGAA
ncbi:NAD(P)/FAD-dependent oxidoreductase [Oceanicella sp. SM1341]|uniref:FAD/NAD(P)-dependent oxidoreductase n=1 Tax=Oceanicella sp. SM1341 TaxID=1548889 RepID=UPI000E4A9497|nr:NAD(P)/FAD-dependent oxidoreductase [Oceanicella sp. SM1341]